MAWPKSLPVPFGDKQTLGDANYKLVVLQSVVDRNFAIAALVTSFAVMQMLVLFFNFPFSIFFFVELYFALLTVSAVYMLKECKNLPNDNTGNAYKKSLLVTAKYSFLRSLLFIAVVCGIVFFGFRPLGPWLETMFAFTNNDSVLAIIQSVLFVVLPTWLVIKSLVVFFRYRYIAGFNEQLTIPEIQQRTVVFDSKVAFIGLPVVLAVLTYGILASGLPLYLLGVLYLILVPFSLLSWIEIRRTESANLSIGNPKPAATIAVNDPDEKILASAWGISNASSYSASVLGAGKTHHPEDGIIVTNKRLLLVVLPMPGNNQVVGSNSWRDVNMVWNRGDYKKRGEELIKTASLSEILATNSENYAIGFNEIETVYLKNRPFVRLIVKLSKNHKNFSFNLYPEMLDTLRSSLQACLNDKVIDQTK